MTISKGIYKQAFNLLSSMPFIAVLATVFIAGNDLQSGIINGRYFWFYVLMLLIAIAAPLLYFSNRKEIKISVTDLLTVMLAVSVLLSSLAFNDNLNATRITFFVLLVILYFFFRVLFSQYINSVHLIILTIIVIVLCEAILGLMQLYGFAYSNHSLFRITGTFYNPGPYAGYLSTGFPIALYWCLDFEKKRKDLRIMNLLERKLPDKVIWKNLFTYILGILSILTTISIFLVLPASMSRASWFAVLTGSGAVIFLYYYNQTETLRHLINKYKKYWLLISCALVIISTLCFTGIYHFKKDSADGRFLMWKVSMQAAVQNPLGVGLGHFPNAYGKSQIEYFLSGKASEQEKNVAGNPEYAFNEYLQIAVESGFISLFLYLALISLAMRNALENAQYGIFGAILSLSVFAFFSYPFSMLPHLILIVTLLAAAATNPKPDSKESGGNLVLKGSIIVSFTIATIFCLANRYPTYKAYKNWNAQFYYSNGAYTETAERYEQLYHSIKDDIKFLFEYAQYLANVEKYEQSNKILQRAMQISCDPMLYNIMGKNYQALKQYDNAEQYFVTSTLLVPNLLYPHYLIAKMYDEMGNKEKALEAANVILTKKPKIHSTAIDEMRQEAKKIIDANSIMH